VPKCELPGRPLTKEAPIVVNDRELEQFYHGVLPEVADVGLLCVCVCVCLCVCESKM
jgi:hypothetical protein